MKEQLIYFSPLVDFIIKTFTFPSYNSNGSKSGIVLPMDKSQLISDVSYLLGKLDMCIVFNDQENFDSIISIMKFKCQENDIIFEEYDEWLNNQ